MRHDQLDGTIMSRPHCGKEYCQDLQQLYPYLVSVQRKNIKFYTKFTFKFSLFVSYSLFEEG